VRLRIFLRVEKVFDRALLEFKLMGRGFAWLDTRMQDSLIGAADFVRTLEKRRV
jgi:glucose-1-phosphate thymidylyltransferase